MAKGLTSGYAPLGAVGMKHKISDFFNDYKFQGGLTYNSHPISLAAAIANIKVIQDDQLIKKSQENGILLRHLLTDLGEKHPSVGDVRSIGLFGVIELVRDRKTKQPMAPYNSSSPEMENLRKSLLNQGLFLYTHWHTILVIPPLCIEPEQLKEGFQIIDDTLVQIDKVVDRST
jgi:taurine--2-oxoglutarate transaminase